MTTIRDHDAAVVRARINATALRLSDSHTSLDEAVSELAKVTTLHHLERHGRRSARWTPPRSTTPSRSCGPASQK